MKTRICKIINRIDDHIIDNKVYYISATVMFAVYIICLFITSSYPFGRAFSIPGDGMVQSYTFNLSQYEKIHSGNLFSYFISDIAGFMDVYRNNILYFVFHPWMILKYLLFPKSSLIYLLILEYLVFYIFSPIAFILYLTKRRNNRYDKHDKRLIYISLLYGLSNYALSFYMYESLKFLQVLPLLLLGVEKLIYDKKPALYICLLTYLIITDPYHAFIVCLFLVLYFFTFNFDSFKDFFFKGLRFAVNSIVSALLSAVTILPFFLLSVTDSPYQQYDSQAPSLLKFYTSYIKMFSDYHIANMNKTISEDYSTAAIYCSLLVLFVLPMYLLCKKINLKTRIKYFVLLTIIFISFNNELLNYVFHGFHYQSLVPNRHAVFFVLIGCILLADTVINIEEVKAKTVIYSTLIISVILTCIYVTNLNLNKFTSILTLCLIILYVANVSIYGFLKKQDSGKLINILLYIAVFDIIINSIFNFSFQISDKPTAVDVSAEVDKIADSCPDMEDFYVSTELLGTNSDLVNIGLSSRINSLSFFSSGFTSDTLSRISYYNIHSVLNSFTYRGGNPLADMMLHVKYHIEDVNDDTAYSVYPEKFKYNNYSIHENPYYISMGFVVADRSVNDKIVRTGFDSCFDYQNMLSSYLGGSDIYEAIECEAIPKNTTDSSELDGSKNYFFPGETYKDKNANNTETEYRTVYIHLNESIQGYIYASVDNLAYCIGEADENNHDFSIDYPKEYVDDDKSFKPVIAVFDPEAFGELHDKLDDSILTNLKSNGREITADFDSATDGALYISMPYYSGWDIYVDGIKQEKSRYIGGMGVDVTAGHHTLELKYTPPGMVSGILISSITLLLVIAYNIVRTMIKRKTSDKEA